MATHLALHIECLRGVAKHDCLLLCPDDVEHPAIHELLLGAFKTCEMVSYPPRLKGWPDGPNLCFAVAAEAVYTRFKQPWLWLEPDCVPTRSAWLDEIESEYRYCGKPVLGVFENTYGEDGKISGRHVNGVAVYPGDWWKICAPIRSLVGSTEGYRLSGNLPPAFDTLQAPYSVPRCIESQTIRNLWKSYCFYEENGVVRCRFKQKYGASEIVDMTAALIHGAKDTSLLDLVQRRLCGNASLITRSLDKSPAVA